MHYKTMNPFPISLGHYSHCFDFIRQSVVCDASDHLFASQIGGHTGNGQKRQCRDWATLRDWATKNSACDPNDRNHQNDFLAINLCHGSNDGVVDFSDENSL